MSIKLTSWFWENCEDFTNGELLVALAMADIASDCGLLWPFAKNITKKARCHKSTLFSTFNKMENQGLLVRYNRTGSSTIYHLVTPQNDEIDMDVLPEFVKEVLSTHPNFGLLRQDGCTHAPNPTPSNINRNEPPLVDGDNLFENCKQPIQKKKTKEQYLDSAKQALERGIHKHMNGCDEIPSGLPEHLFGLWRLVEKAACNPPKLSEWRKSLSELWDSGIREPHAISAIREMQEKGLDIYSPASILKIALKHKQGKQRVVDQILEAGSPEWNAKYGRV